VQAARAAEVQAAAQRDEAREAMVRDLEAARYAADRAFRQYDAADPENRFVAGELEARWNRTLIRVAEFEKRIIDHDAAAQPRLDLEPISFTALADDLQTVWSAPTTDARLKKRIVRTVIHEVMADLDDATSEILLTIHWVGGVHTQHRLPRRRRGQRNSTSADIVSAVRVLADRPGRRHRGDSQPQRPQDRSWESLDPRTRGCVTIQLSDSGVREAADGVELAQPWRGRCHLRPKFALSKSATH
jgi:hypothetical protein